jgi:hypothetical protein
MKGGMHVIMSKGRGLTPTSNGLGRRVNQNYQHLSPLIKMGDDLIGI